METYVAICAIVVCSVFAAYLKGMETLFCLDVHSGYVWFAAYLKGMETYRDPRVRDQSLTFAAYLKGMETLFVRANEYHSF